MTSGAGSVSIPTSSGVSSGRRCGSAEQRVLVAAHPERGRGAQDPGPRVPEHHARPAAADDARQRLGHHVGDRGRVGRRREFVGELEQCARTVGLAAGPPRARSAGRAPPRHGRRRRRAWRPRRPWRRSRGRRARRAGRGSGGRRPRRPPPRAAPGRRRRAASPPVRPPRPPAPRRCGRRGEPPSGAATARRYAGARTAWAARATMRCRTVSTSSEPTRSVLADCRMRSCPRSAVSSRSAARGPTAGQPAPPVPPELVDAGGEAVGLALAVHDLGGGQVEDRGYRAEQALRVVAVQPGVHVPVVQPEADGRRGRARLEDLHGRGGRELRDGARQLPDDLSRRAHGAQEQHDRVRQSTVQGRRADLEHRGRVPEDLGGRGEQPDPGVVAPPAGLVVELLGGVREPAQREHPCDGVVPTVGADVPEQPTGGGARRLPGLTGPRAGHRVHPGNAGIAGIAPGLRRTAGSPGRPGVPSMCTPATSAGTAQCLSRGATRSRDARRATRGGCRSRPRTADDPGPIGTGVGVRASGGGAAISGRSAGRRSRLSGARRASPGCSSATGRGRALAGYARPDDAAASWTSRCSWLVPFIDA